MSISDACCQGPGDECVDGLPTTCSTTCASIVVPFAHACYGQFSKIDGMTTTINNAVALCPWTQGGGTRPQTDLGAELPCCVDCQGGCGGSEADECQDIRHTRKINGVDLGVWCAPRHPLCCVPEPRVLPIGSDRME